MYRMQWKAILIYALHYSRTITKCYIQVRISRSPIPVVKLNGYGDYVSQDVPVVVTNFTLDIKPTEIDYIAVYYVQDLEKYLLQQILMLKNHNILDKLLTFQQNLVQSLHHLLPRFEVENRLDKFVSRISVLLTEDLFNGNESLSKNKNPEMAQH